MVSVEAKKTREAALAGIELPGHLPIRARVPLASLTTLGLGGEAAFFAQPVGLDAIQSCLAWGREKQLPLWVLGGGSNVVLPTAGLPGLVIQLRGVGREVCAEDAGGRVLVRVDAGHDWDELVAWSVGEGLAGIECLSGIPGFVGAAPIQNIGAYGQELRGVFAAATVLDLTAGEVSSWDAARCDFGYRDSLFKRSPGQYLVLDVTLALQRGGAPTLRYKELIDAVAALDEAADAVALGSNAAKARLARTREVVLRLRRGKSMVINSADPNSRSTGSFFTNPIVEEACADEAWARLAPQLPAGLTMPRYPVEEAGFVKLSAAWLIEKSGLSKGVGVGAVGLSEKHTLALINRGGATTEALLGFARLVQAHVFAACGVMLHPEPVLLGMEGVTLDAFTAPPFAALD